MPLLKTSDKKYLYSGMDWKSFEGKLENLSFQQNFWESFQKTVKKCLQFLGIVFLLLLGFLFWYTGNYENMTILWQQYIEPEVFAQEEEKSHSNEDQGQAILIEQKAIKEEIKKSTQQIHLLELQIKEWQSHLINSLVQTKTTEATNKIRFENIQVYHYQAFFPPRILIYLPQNYHKLFIGFQISNVNYTAKEKYYIYQDSVSKGWYQITIRDWIKQKYLLKILYTHPFDLLPQNHKILELTSSYSIPQSVETIDALNAEEITNTDPGYGFVELLKREF